MIRTFSILAFFFFFVLFSLNYLFPIKEKVESIQYSTIIAATHGELIHAYLTDDEKWRIQTSLKEISPLLRKTIVEKEDRFFYYHAGINPFAMLRAVLKNTLKMKRTSGASTITMQVARALERRPRTYISKLVEMFRAVQLECHYSKNEILQLYCNLLPYGGNVEGVKSASLIYFQKDPDHLSLAEITALCIVPNRPSTLVPGKNNAMLLQERNRWLEHFQRNGVFTKKEIADALAEPLDASRHVLPKLAPHVSRLLANTGKRDIRSSIDLNLQLKTEKLVADYARSLKLKGVSNAAVVVIDNITHRVIAYVGSADFSSLHDAGEVDGAIAVRQPGSTLKPLLYAMCMDEGFITPKTVIPDVQVSYAGYSPENYDKTFNGYVSMEYALEHSLNIPAVRCLNRLGKEKFMQALSSCNFKQIRKDEKKLGLSMILGGCGANLLELTALYSTFASGGTYVKPSFIANDSSAHKVQVISAASAFMINETLSKLNRPDFPINWQSTEHLPKIAWKTGTSYGRRDAWSIGYNRNYTIGIWTGNFSGEGVRELSGAEVATPLLFRVFNTLDYDSDEGWFQQPDDCDIRMVCAETGLPPSDYCTDKITDFFIPSVSATAKCNNMQEEIVSADGKLSYCRACAPANGYRTKMFRMVSPEMQLYFDEHQIAYQKIPPHNPDCEQVFKNSKPQIVSPGSNLEYLINRHDPEPLKLQCRAGNDVNKVYWYVDNRFYKGGDINTPVYFMPSEGPVKISCTDDKGRNRDVWIKVKYIDM